MSKAYKLQRGSVQEKFQNSRAKIQIFGGGYGNGKTTSGVIKGLQLARDYPGSNGLVARSTYPKLSNTIRKEFNSWTPKAWIKRNVDSKVNLIELTNGSVINFSHIQQTGKGTDDHTSNLLSATYDWILIDQVEDPEISEKDFTDLLGRLRGSTVYSGSDTTMPSDGPRWMMLLCNPTRNWVYRKLVKPLKDSERGINNPELIVDVDGKPMIELYEGSTYTNKANLPADFIATLEASYKGQMRSRYLMGGWEAYEGLVYPDYNPDVHFIDHSRMLEYYYGLVELGAYSNIIESYDHGIAQPACYLFGFTDHQGNVFILDGLYQKELAIRDIAWEMKRIRKEHGYEAAEDAARILADPAIFRRSSGKSTTVGTTTAGLFQEHGIFMTKGNNDILNGIAKVQSYLYIDKGHVSPFDPEASEGAPRLYISKRLDWWDREIVDYNWKKDTTGEYEDVPIDRMDHAMDATKYLLTNRPNVATFRLQRMKRDLPSQYRRWREAPMSNQAANTRKHRYG